MRSYRDSAKKKFENDSSYKCVHSKTLKSHPTELNLINFLRKTFEFRTVPRKKNIEDKVDSFSTFPGHSIVYRDRGGALLQCNVNFDDVIEQVISERRVKPSVYAHLTLSGAGTVRALRYTGCACVRGRLSMSTLNHNCFFFSFFLSLITMVKLTHTLTHSHNQ